MAQRSCPYDFFAFTSRRAAGDRRLQARRAARALNQLVKDALVIVRSGLQIFFEDALRIAHRLMG
jgi:hypothetical protein